MNIVLIKPWSNGFEFGRSHMIGLVSIAAFLRANGHNPSIIDAAFLGLSEDRLHKRLINCDAQIYGITAMTHEIPKVKKIINWIKELNSEAICVLGGPHASAIPQETLEEIQNLDFVVDGEGETPFLKLIDHIEKNKKTFTFEGIAYRHKSEIIYTGKQKENWGLIITSATRCPSGKFF